MEESQHCSEQDTEANSLSDNAWIAYAGLYVYNISSGQMIYAPLPKVSSLESEYVFQSLNDSKLQFSFLNGSGNVNRSNHYPMEQDDSDFKIMAEYDDTAFVTSSPINKIGRMVPYTVHFK